MDWLVWKQKRFIFYEHIQDARVLPYIFHLMKQSYTSLNQS